MIFLGYFVKVDEGDVEDKEEMEARIYEDREKNIRWFYCIVTYKRPQRSHSLFYNK